MTTDAWFHRMKSAQRDLIKLAGGIERAAEIGLCAGPFAAPLLCDAAGEKHNTKSDKHAIISPLSRATAE